MNFPSLFAGYIETPQLWKGTLLSITQLDLDEIPTPKLPDGLPPSLRLGHLAEYFTFVLWKQHPEIELIANNIQVPVTGLTLGEIDAIINFQERLTHIEIAFKFYLFDPKHGAEFLDHWIGPNRNDTLMAKLERLRYHQLPFVQSPEAQQAVASRIDSKEIAESKVWLKGQLFLPYGASIDCSPLNNACISGIYGPIEMLSNFDTSKFHLPAKQEWLCVPHVDVPWKSADQIREEIAPLLEREFSPMLWKKEPNGIVSKLFVVWW